MRVMISSTISDMGRYRIAAENAIRNFATDRKLDVTTLMSEEHSSKGESPLEVCRALVEQSDCVVGICGSNYGYVDVDTGKSATHLEALWAINEFKVPLLAFVINAQHYDPRQQQLIHILNDFRLGVYMTNVDTPESLQYQLYRALGTELPRIGREVQLVERAHLIATQELRHVEEPIFCGDSYPALRVSRSIGDTLLADAVDQHLQDGFDAVFVLGEVGSGKSWFLKRMFLTRLEEFQRTGQGPPAVLVDLVEAVGIQSDSSLVRLSDSQSNVLSSASLLLLDAYDEAVAKSAPGSRLRLLQSALSLAGPGRQLVITSRSHLFETQDQLDRLISAAAPQSRSKERPFKHATVYIRPLGDWEVQDFLKRQYNDSEGELWDRLRKVIDLPDLARRPVLLPMVCDSLAGLEQLPSAGPVTAGALYRVYTQSWLGRESWRLSLSETGARSFFQDMALKFHNAAIDAVSFDKLWSMFPEYFPREILSVDRERVLEGLRTATFLSSNESGKCTFVHRSFLEYFLAERIIVAIKEEQVDLVLSRFPSKVTDSFIVNILLVEPSKESELLSLAAVATSPIVRYLSAYLLSRLASNGAGIDIPRVIETLSQLVARDNTQFVTREFLVSMIQMGWKPNAGLLWTHLRDPIPNEVIKTELKDYYGSLEEAREYLRAKLDPMNDDPLRLFYLISLSSIAEQQDESLLLAFYAAGRPTEKYVAVQGLGALIAEGAQGAN
jgi:hypothetical protein